MTDHLAGLELGRLLAMKASPDYRDTIADINEELARRTVDAGDELAETEDDVFGPIEGPRRYTRTDHPVEPSPPAQQTCGHPVTDLEWKDDITVCTSCNALSVILEHATKMSADELGQALRGWRPGPGSKPYAPKKRRGRPKGLRTKAG